LPPGPDAARALDLVPPPARSRGILRTPNRCERPGLRAVNPSAGIVRERRGGCGESWAGGGRGQALAINEFPPQDFLSRTIAGSREFNGSMGA